MKLCLQFLVFILNEHQLLLNSLDNFRILGVKNYFAMNVDPCNRYITLCGDKPTDHIMCNQYAGPLVNCTEFELINMEFELKLQILAGHNGLRNMEAQRPNYEIRNMNRLFWDNVLGEMAKQSVMRCNVYGPPDECHYILDKNHTIGQNSYYSKVFYGYKHWLSEAIHSWYNYSTASNRPPHFERPTKFSPTTQFLWPASLYVGCAAARVTGGLYFVCYYGPRGHVAVVGETFRQGKPCSDCPIGATCSGTFPALCELGGIGFIGKHPNPYCIVFFTWLNIIFNGLSCVNF